VLLLLAACGASAREKALHTALVGLDAARSGFVAWDAQHQDAIVEAYRAKPYEEGRGALLAYRGRRDLVVQAFVVAYSAVAVAALDNTPAKLVEAARAVQAAYDLILKLKGGSP